MEFGKNIRKSFPIYANNLELAYLDSAASSFKPEVVIQRINNYLSFEHANIHRGAYHLSAQATDNYEAVRIKLAKLFNIADEKSFVFTKGATESINLVAFAFEDFFNQGDGILLTQIEHHSNIVPWQMLAERKKLKIEFAKIDQAACLDYQDFEDKLKTLKPKLIAITHIANSFGTEIDIFRVVELARKYQAKILIDACQSVAHKKIDLAALDPDFLVFSGHKIYGPTGIGVLYTKKQIRELLKPYQGGGDMIREVTEAKTTYADYPQRFEAGTPPIAEVIALGTAIEFLESLDLAQLEKYEQDLFENAFSLLSKQSDLKIYGPATVGKKQTSILPFNIEGVHPHDFATIADSIGVQIRAGNHCAMPALKALGLNSSARASIGVYTCIEDFEKLLEAVKKACRILKK